MKRILLILLLCSAAMAEVDVYRSVVYEVHDDLSTTATYHDEFYGDWANWTYQAMTGADSEFDYIKERLPLTFEIAGWSRAYTEGLLEVNATGEYVNFVSPAPGGEYKVSGKGFLDDLCTEYPVAAISAIKQDFESVAIIPEGMVLARYPSDWSADLGHISYSYKAGREGNELHESVHMEVKESVDILTYCVERNEMEKVIMQGFWIKPEGARDLTGIFVTMMLILLLVTMWWSVRSK